jgi:hypothetical protein
MEQSHCPTSENLQLERLVVDARARSMEVQAIHLLPAMHNTLRDYEQYCKDRLHLRPSTLHRRTTELTIFLDFLHTRKARTPTNLPPTPSQPSHFFS